VNLHDLTLRDQLLLRDRLHGEWVEMLEQKKELEQSMAEKRKQIDEAQEEIKSGMISRKIPSFVFGSRMVRLGSGAFGNPKDPTIYFDDIYVIPPKE
jgi:hypothetical protein